MPNTCSKCQSEFTCEARTGHSCWCMNLPALLKVEEQSDCFCPGCLTKMTAQQIENHLAGKDLEQALQFAKKHQKTGSFVEYIDYIVEDKDYVFTKWYHLKRGACCDNGCRNCPF